MPTTLDSHKNFFKCTIADLVSWVFNLILYLKSTLEKIRVMLLSTETHYP